MSRNFYIKKVALSISLLCLSCFSNTTIDCDFCFKTSLVLNKDTFLIEMVFFSRIDTTLVLPGEVLTVGCPFYQEEQVYFESSKPDIDELNHTQIVLENERGNFRVFSSQFVRFDEETIIRNPDCAFIGEKTLAIKANEDSFLAFNVWYLDDLKVDQEDNKVRLHIYYKDETNMKGVVMSSSNWLKISE